MRVAYFPKYDKVLIRYTYATCFSVTGSVFSTLPRGDATYFFFKFSWGQKRMFFWDSLRKEEVVALIFIFISSFHREDKKCLYFYASMFYGGNTTCIGFFLPEVLLICRFVGRG